MGYCNRTLVERIIAHKYGACSMGMAKVLLQNRRARDVAVCTLSTQGRALRTWCGWSQRAELGRHPSHSRFGGNQTFPRSLALDLPSWKLKRSDPSQTTHKKLINAAKLIRAAKRGMRPTNVTCPQTRHEAHKNQQLAYETSTVEAPKRIILD